MSDKPYSDLNIGHFDCSLELLNYRNKSILFWVSIGFIWLWLFIEVFNVVWFWEQFNFALQETRFEIVSEKPGGDPCEINEYDSCVRRVSEGSVWWSLLGSLLTGIAIGPLVFAGLIFSYRTKNVTKKWRDEIWGCLFFINPSIIWALMWLICLPYTWTLLPWGAWETNWWKVFPFFFGLIWIGLTPAFFIIVGFWKLFFNPKYDLELPKYQQDEEKEDSVKAQIENEVAGEITKSAGSIWDSV